MIVTDFMQYVKINLQDENFTLEDVTADIEPGTRCRAENKLTWFEDK
jgi:hypothetical protein